MGNLEKAGVLVVVALLAVILVVAFLNFPDQGTRAPVLGASVGKSPTVPEAKKPKPVNVLPTPPSDVIRPRPDGDRATDTAPPVTLDPPPRPFVTPPPPAPEEKTTDTLVKPEPAKPKPEPDKKPSNIAAAGYPKTVKVQQGESLWAIAVREYGPKLGPRMVGAIADANPRVRPEALKAGTDLALPPPPAEVADAGTKPKAEAPVKKASSGTSAKAQPDPAKPPVRRLPFTPN